VTDLQKKRTRGVESTGPVAALEVWVFGGGEQPLKRSCCFGGPPGHMTLATPELYITEAGRVEPSGYFFEMRSPGLRIVPKKPARDGLLRSVLGDIC